MIISRQDLLMLIDKHFEPFLCRDKYEILNIKPSKLITYNRLDLAFKIFYLQMKEFEKVLFAKDLYLRHVKAFSLGSFQEPGNDRKNTAQKYLEDFDDIYLSVKKYGIAANKSVIPCSINGSISNGAHRVSAAYMLNKEIPSVILDTPDDKYDFNFFLNRGMSQSDIDCAVTKFIEIAENCYVAIVWPSAQGMEAELRDLIPNIIYQNDIPLNYKGAHNLLSQVYFGEAWLGAKDENYPGVKNKLVKCFKTFDKMRVIAFQAECLNEVLLLKEKIRQLFNIGKHSVHISDTKEESIRIARILFNENGIHFLNHSSPNKYPATYRKIVRFKTFLENNHTVADRVVLDSSIVLSLYGVRECNDIDYLSIDGNLKFHDELIENHADILTYHQEEKNELILNKRFYFYYEDLKFISFEQLYKMKKNRAEEKDINDLILMKSLIENNSIKRMVGQIKQKYYFFKVKLRLRMMGLLRYMGLYKGIRHIYHLIKDRTKQ